VLRPLALSLLVAVTIAHADAPPGAPRQPIILRLEGHFTADRATARIEGVDAIEIRVGDVERWFAVDSARNMNALGTVSGRAVLAALAPIEPTLTAVGDPRLRQRLTDSPTGASIRVEGLVDRGSHTYLLREVADAMPPKLPSP
jgi:hypothetical protein